LRCGGRNVTETFDGGCLCGAVRYRATGSASFATLCHCTSCRRASAAPAVAWVTFPHDAFAVTRGEPVRFRSSPPVVRSFCGRCGTPLTYEHESFAGAVDVTTASLDEPERCPPLDHTWVSERLSWWRPEPRWPELPRSRSEGGAAADAEVIGLDHAYLTVSDLARSTRFYDAVLGALGFRRAEEPIGGEPHAHYWNRALQLSLRPAHAPGARHDPYSPGLHHLCLQVRDRAAVDTAFAKLRALEVVASAPRLYPEYNPDYYATFFSDPDGIRLELVARKAKRDEIVATWDRR
jgi:catechol 2,3-dioxygenase-like lactoylglutathione lyase family enzyme